ncbi:MAG TPA: Dyp-type peroxidase [Candidatus Angelobacter sp.]|nr:Dyp-type peroxidase [Candidatus Angelobacter sp.]
MSKLNPTDIQGFVLRGYNLPFARYVFLHLSHAESGRKLINGLLGKITTGQHWDKGKPQWTLNLAFTHRGLATFDLPPSTLVSFPVEFQQGMQARGGILGDTGLNSSEHWDPIWLDGRIHVWLGIHAQSSRALEDCFADVVQQTREAGGVEIVGTQDASSITIDGQLTAKEHFGFTDGFGNPDYVGVERKSQPGQGKLMPNGKWEPLATGELLLGYADEAGELPVAPIPHIFAANGTFMVYRKLHQNVATFRQRLDEWGAAYPGGKEKLAAKMVGRWRDGTPTELSPDTNDPELAQDPGRNTNFTFANDSSGSRCPLGAHVRRSHPRDAFGFSGRLINRRRITRRGMPYGTYVPEGEPVLDHDERGVVFMALNACISRQFEFVQQQWIEYGNDQALGNDKDGLAGNHGGKGKFVIQGDTTPANPPFICSRLPNFVELRGGDYFFLPSITALKMLALGVVDPR